jgi:methyl-accepting chemotaxis protein
VQAGVTSVENTGTVITRLSEVIDQVAARARAIAIGANEQVVAYEQITAAMAGITAAANEYSVSTAQVDSGNAALLTLAAAFDEIVGGGA